MSYEKRGVSAGKEEVHAAIKNLDKGLVPNAFCKVLPDFAAGDSNFCNVLHADTAGTKTSLAYLYWKETGDLSVWKGIVQDSIVMNLDDMGVSGILDNFILSNTIGRNKSLVSGDVIAALIEGATEFADNMSRHGVNIRLAGGETADVGDIVRTADVGFTAFARAPLADILPINIKPGQVVIGVSSAGQATYENEYNSGIGSNGLSFARHEVLHSSYGAKYPESFSPEIDTDVVYTGSRKLTDLYQGHTVGKLLLSPTRTFLPLLRAIFASFRPHLHGIIHNTGGGQTKVLHFASGVEIIKDNLLGVPAVFHLIQEERNTPWREMFKVFNMGQRLEIYTSAEAANDILSLCASFNLSAQVIGHVREATGPASVSLSWRDETIMYTKD